VKSEDHKQQLHLFSEKPEKYIDTFSADFEHGYLEVLKRNFGAKLVNANSVYQNYLSQTDHIHMNSTRWETLTDFVKCLGRQGKCVVEEHEKGWYIQATTGMQKDHVHKKMYRDNQEKMMAFITKQIGRGKECDKRQSPVFTEFVREREEDKVVVNLNFKDSKEQKNRAEKRKASALDDIIKDEKRKKHHINRKDYWLVEGIVVKMIAKSLGDKYYKKKGVVSEVSNKYVATVLMLDSGHKVKLDQAHLQTVIPAVGRPVVVVNRAYRGCSATLKELHEKKFCVTIEISSGPLKGRIVDNVEYEDISKAHNMDV
jgi:DNA/RNA-binding protein KIN17